MTTLVRRVFFAAAANELWPGDITEHWTKERKLYVCAIKDVFSNRIVSVASPSAYTSLTPYRICDTRGTNGLSGTDAQCAGHTLSAGGTLNIEVAGTDPRGPPRAGFPRRG